jgi:hypothetical protein
MIIKTMIELIQDNWTLVQYVKYSNGKLVKRILDRERIPVDILNLN